jgi:hypothetical protein
MAARAADVSTKPRWPTDNSGLPTGVFMRRLYLLLIMFCTLPAWADNHDQLYKVAGWPEQRAHFNDALDAAQQRYRNSLPPAVFQALVNNSNKRFAPQAMDTRAEARLPKDCRTSRPATTVCC